MPRKTTTAAAPTDTTTTQETTVPTTKTTKKPAAAKAAKTATKATAKTTAAKSAAKAPTAKAPTTPTVGTAGFEWPKDPASILLDYLVAEVSDAADAPNRSKPFISTNGLLRLHSSDWREWLVSNGMAPTKGEAAKVLRDAGLSPRAYALPGEERSLGFYTGDAPSGTDELPRRQAVRTAGKPRNLFAKLTGDQLGVLKSALANYKPTNPGKVAAQAAKDELLNELAKLDAATE